jgi:hypothetical protein
MTTLTIHQPACGNAQLTKGRLNVPLCSGGAMRPPVTDEQRIAALFRYAFGLTGAVLVLIGVLLVAH